jgi:amino-acid N-acetyltransferase
MNQEQQLRMANEADLPAIEALLKANALPYSDLGTSAITFIVATAGPQINGCIGIESLDEVGLLRSFAVANTYKNQGIGKALFNSLLQYAHQNGVSEIFLLTTTAAAYFEKQNFIKISRDQVPIPIQNTTEFAGICPTSATVMHFVFSNV